MRFIMRDGEHRCNGRNDEPDDSDNVTSFMTEIKLSFCAIVLTLSLLCLGFLSLSEQPGRHVPPQNSPA